MYIILSLAKDEVCVLQNCFVVLVVGGVACALNKSLAAFGGRGPKDHLGVGVCCFFLVVPPQQSSQKKVSKSYTPGISIFSETYARQI